MEGKELLEAISDMLDEKLEQKLEQKFEEKLKPIRDDVSGLKNDVSGLKNDVSGLKKDVSELKEKVTSLENRQTRTELIIETEIRPNIQLLVETCVPAIKRYEKLETRLDAMQMDIDVMKVAIRKNGDKLQRIS